MFPALRHIQGKESQSDRARISLVFDHLHIVHSIFTLICDCNSYRIELLKRRALLIFMIHI